MHGARGDRTFRSNSPANKMLQALATKKKACQYELRMSTTRSHSLSHEDNNISNSSSDTLDLWNKVFQKYGFTYIHMYKSMYHAEGGNEACSPVLSNDHCTEMSTVPVEFISFDWSLPLIY